LRKEGAASSGDAYGYDLSLGAWHLLWGRTSLAAGVLDVNSGRFSPHPCDRLIERRRAYTRLMQEATQAAPNPLSIFTTLTFDAQLFSMPSNAATPPKLAP
jgi:hypothetical protein